MPWSLPEGAVLGLFAKRPEPGTVKTRIAVEHGDAFAAALAEAMLFDMLHIWGSERVLAPGGRRVVVFDPIDAGPWFDARTPEVFALQPQVEGDLGTRMRSFSEGEFEEGASKVVLIGVDSPTLDPTFVISAFLLLEQKDVVLGPASDGGYYLIGVRPPLAPIFDEIEWSTPAVLMQTVARLEARDRSLALLPPWYDVDTAESVRMLAGHIRAMRLAGMEVELPRTEPLLMSMDKPGCRPRGD
jgi:hypothetical protein